MKIGVNSVWKKTYFFLIFDITYGDHRDRDHIVVEFISICAVTAKAVTRCSQYLSLVTWYLALDEVYSVVVSCDVVSHPWRGVLSGCLLWRGISPVTRCTQWLSTVTWYLALDEVYSVVVSCDVEYHPWQGVLSGCPVTWYLALDEMYSVVVSCVVVSPLWRCVLSGCPLWCAISPVARCTH
jgi:hypothetical protein